VRFKRNEAAVALTAVLLMVMAFIAFAGDAGSGSKPYVPAHAAESDAAGGAALDPKRPHAEAPGEEWNKKEPPPAATFPAEPSPAGEPSMAPPAPVSTPSPDAAMTPNSTADAIPSPADTAAAHLDSATVTASVYKNGKTAAGRFSIPVLNYHSVAVDPGNIVVIHPDKFEEQMKYLHDNGYTTLKLAEFFDILERKAAPPEKPVLLTFDDGYTDNYETAMPILKKYKQHATLFMSPGMIDTPGYINWDQAQAMLEAGWDIQPHGMTHPSLPKLSAEKQAYEITEARKLIEANLKGTVADVFCYPYGQYNKDTLDILSKNGFRYAFTIDQGKTDSGQHPFKLKRIFVNGEEKLGTLVHKLTKW